MDWAAGKLASELTVICLRRVIACGWTMGLQLGSRTIDYFLLLQTVLTRPISDCEEVVRSFAQLSTQVCALKHSSYANETWYCAT